LIGLYKGVDEQTDRDRFHRFEEVLEIREEKLSDGLILWALNEREDQSLVNCGSRGILFGGEFIK